MNGRPCARMERPRDGVIASARRSADQGLQRGRDMAKDDGSRPSAEPVRPKRMRRRLEKLEGRLAEAKDKRDRAQARVDALTIIVGEAQAALGSAEAPAEAKAPAQPKAPAQAKAPAEAASPPQEAPPVRPAARRSTTTGRASAKAAGSAATTRRPSTKGRDTSTGRTTRSTSTRTTRRRPASDGGA